MRWRAGAFRRDEAANNPTQQEIGCLSGLPLAVVAEAAVAKARGFRRIRLAIPWREIARFLPAASWCDPRRDIRDSKNDRQREQQDLAPAYPFMPTPTYSAPFFVRMVLAAIHTARGGDEPYNRGSERV